MLMAQTSDLLSLIDDQGCFAYASPSFERILGLDPRLLLGTPAVQLLHPNDRALWHPAAELADAPLTLRFRHADGSWRWIELQRDLVIRDDLRYSVQVGRDVSERFVAENRRQHDTTRLYHEAWQHTQYLQMLAEATRAFAEVSLDLGALLERIVRHAATILGDVGVIRLLSDDGIWLNPVAAFHPEPATALWSAVPARIVDVSADFAGSVVQSGKTLLITSAHDPLPASIDPESRAALERYGIYSLLAVPLRVQGQIIGTLLLARGDQQRPYTEADQHFLEDIADRAALAISSALLYAAERQARHAAERAAQRTARLQAVTAALAEALTPAQVSDVIVREGVKALGADAGSIYIRSDDGASLELLTYIGYPDELQPAHARVPMDAQSPLNDAIHSRELIVAETVEDLIGQWPRLAAAQAITGDAAVAAAPLLVDQKVLGAIYMAFRTPRQFNADDRALLTTLARQCAQAFERSRLYAAEQQARSAAQEAVHLRDAFLSIASHELKTPVTALLGYVELLQRRAQQNGAAERDLRSIQIIHDQAWRLTNLIGTLLDISRIETGQLRLDPAPLDLRPLVEQIISEMEPVFERYTFSYELAAEALIVNGDAVRLEQVLHNLFQNATRYSPAGSTVTIRLWREDRTARLSVTDQGIGIPATALPHIFQRFFRAHTGDTHRISGLGIGLYVVKEIVALHGGSVEVESAEGAGSTFTVTLPLAGERMNKGTRE
ncbi:MAG TPA: GAF domain-containing protein [Herpetosiphonaceae bacterium]